MLMLLREFLLVFLLSIVFLVTIVIWFKLNKYKYIDAAFQAGDSREGQPRFKDKRRAMLRMIFIGSGMNYLRIIIISRDLLW